MSTLHPAQTSTRQFTWEPENRRYVGEISGTNGFGRVYDDACDVGMTLVSARTGREVVFVVEREFRDADGDVTHWILRPADRSGLAAELVLFND